MHGHDPLWSHKRVTHSDMLMYKYKISLFFAQQ